MNWKNTSTALSQLHNQFICKICAGYLNDPCILEKCQHYLCRPCCEKCDGTCPVCQMPFCPKEISQSVSLRTVLSLIKQMHIIINQSDTTLLSDETSTGRDSENSFLNTSISRSVTKKSENIKSRFKCYKNMSPFISGSDTISSESSPHLKTNAQDKPDTSLGDLKSKVQGNTQKEDTNLVDPVSIHDRHGTATKRKKKMEVNRNESQTNKATSPGLNNKECDLIKSPERDKYITQTKDTCEQNSPKTWGNKKSKKCKQKNIPQKKVLSSMSTTDPVIILDGLPSRLSSTCSSTENHILNTEKNNDSVTKTRDHKTKSITPKKLLLSHTTDSITVVNQLSPKSLDTTGKNKTVDLDQIYTESDKEKEASECINGSNSPISKIQRRNKTRNSKQDKFSAKKPMLDIDSIKSPHNRCSSSYEMIVRKSPRNKENHTKIVEKGDLNLFQASIVAAQFSPDSSNTSNVNVLSRKSPRTKEDSRKITNQSTILSDISDFSAVADSFLPSDRKTGNKKSPSRPTVSDASVYDFISSPDSVLGRTRKQTKIKKKKEKIVKSNQRWGIESLTGSTAATSNPEKCSSCKRTRGINVLFKSKNSESNTSKNENEKLSANTQEISDKKISEDITTQDKACNNKVSSIDTNTKMNPSSHKTSNTTSLEITNDAELSSDTSPQKRNNSVNKVNVGLKKLSVVCDKSIHEEKSQSDNAKTPKTAPQDNLSCSSTNTPLKSRRGTKRRSTMPDCVSPLVESHSKRRKSVTDHGSINSPIDKKKNFKGETLLHQAVIKNDSTLVKSLLTEGADVNTRDNAGWTPLHEASNYGYETLVDLLLESGANINAPALNNETPLHDAVENGRVSCVRLLVSWGANISARDHRGLTPVDLAKSKEMENALNSGINSAKIEKYNKARKGQQSYAPVCVTSSGLSREEQGKLQACVKMLHGSSEEALSIRSTHLVTSVNNDGRCPRKIKYLEALLLGKWIVTFDWINTCAEYKEKVSEEPFEVPGSSRSPLDGAPTRARLNHQNQLPRLFEGCNFYLQGSFNYPAPGRKELLSLIEKGGGKVLNREPRDNSLIEEVDTVPYHVTSTSKLSKCSNFIVTANSKGHLEANKLICTVPATWLLDCVDHFAILDSIF